MATAWPGRRVSAYGNEMQLPYMWRWLGDRLIPASPQRSPLRRSSSPPPPSSSSTRPPAAPSTATLHPRPGGTRSGRPLPTPIVRSMGVHPTVPHPAATAATPRMVASAAHAGAPPPPTLLQPSPTPGAASATLPVSAHVSTRLPPPTAGAAMAGVAAAYTVATRPIPRATPPAPAQSQQAVAPPGAVRPVAGGARVANASPPRSAAWGRATVTLGSRPP